MKHDGFYVIEDISTKGKTQTAYHFVNSDYMRSLRNVKLSNEGLLSWYQTNINDDLVKYSLLIPTQISWSSNKNGFHQDGRIARNFGGGVKGSSFYRVKDGRIESITPESSGDREAKSYEIFNDQGELLFKGLYKNLSEISAGYYLVQNEKGYQILNREGKAVSDTYTWIGGRDTSAPRYLMAYDGMNFCVLTPTGQIKIPCKHPDMREMEDYQYAISNGNTQILIDSNGNELFRTRPGEQIAYEQPISSIVSISTPDSRLLSFWSLKSGKHLDMRSNRAGSVSGATDLWTVSSQEGYLVLDTQGKPVLPIFLRSVAFKNGFLVAADNQNRTALFRRDGSRASPVLEGTIEPTYSSDDADALFIYKATNGKQGLVDQSLAAKTEVNYNSIRYLGNGIYSLTTNYRSQTDGNSKRIDLYSLKAGLIPVQAKDIGYLNDDVLAVTIGNGFEGLWSATTLDWVVKPDTCRSISIGNQSNYGRCYYRENDGKDAETMFIDRNGKKLGTMSMQGRVLTYRNLGINEHKEKVSFYRLPDLTFLSETRGRFQSISNFGSIFVKAVD